MASKFVSKFLGKTDMNSISVIEAINSTSLEFHGQQIITAMFEGVAYVAMRPIVENIGIDWAGQSVKLNKQKDKFGCCDIATPSKGGIQKMLCIPLKKLNGWLFSINPSKVRADIRNKLIQYQEECFTVLHDYWTKGDAVNSRKKKAQQGKLTIEQQETIKQLVLTRGKSVPHEHQGKATITLWSALKSHFGCSYKEIAEEKFTEALSLAARIPIEGEFIGKAPLQNNLPAICGRIVLDYENGSVTRTEVVPSNYFIGDIETLMEYLERRGVVVLADEAERRNFVKENLMRLIN